MWAGCKFCVCVCFRTTSTVWAERPEQDDLENPSHSLHSNPIKHTQHTVHKPYLTHCK